MGQWEGNTPFRVIHTTYHFHLSPVTKKNNANHDGHVRREEGAGVRSPSLPP